ncbi:MAG: calcium/sodium antiporter [Gammaproteobacteria bacterium HGW-Gammaproteobacteria-3]|nr:MAG: calcium/sodium antiporter [Gammaproteobacteria bacterium HGW-Gammaproteobacteria-3]
MLLPLAMIIAGLVLLVWSADRFVEGASAVAFYAGMSPLLIGMVIVGFGTSAPEMTVSVIAAVQGNPGLALGNAYGSNIANIALILGVVALIAPVTVHSQVIRKELPVLVGVTLFAFWQLRDGALTRWDAVFLLVVFLGVMGWTIYQGLSSKSDELGQEISEELQTHPMTLFKALFGLVVGLLLLIASSRMLVWGAVSIAQSLGVSDLIIGLTIVAVGTSLPELASSIIAVRKGESDIAIGNVIGSNLFNTTAVVGLAGVIEPMNIPAEILIRDWPMTALLTAVLFVMGYSRQGEGRISRIEGALLLMAFSGYTGYLMYQILEA